MAPKRTPSELPMPVNHLNVPLVKRPRLRRLPGCIVRFLFEHATERGTTMMCVSSVWSRFTLYHGTFHRGHASRPLDQAPPNVDPLHKLSKPTKSPVEFKDSWKSIGDGSYPPDRKPQRRSNSFRFRRRYRKEKTLTCSSAIARSTSRTLDE